MTALYADPTAPRVEADVRRLGMQLLKTCGCGTYSTSQFRPSQVSEGIPDHIAFHPRAGFAFVEWKHPDFAHPDGDRKHPMTDKQKKFREWCQRTGVTYLLVSHVDTIRDWIKGNRCSS